MEKEVIMKKLTIILAAVMMFVLSSCETEYYEPTFGYDDLPAVVPAAGGIYSITYDYQYYETRTVYECFEWNYRIIVDGKVVREEAIKDPDPIGKYMFRVQIDPNRDNWPKSIVVEASTHVFMGVDDWWGDWTPICSAVQLSR